MQTQMIVTRSFEVAATLADRAPLAARWRDASSLHSLDHRLSPVATGKWLMAQTWQHVLFAHWPVQPALIRPMLPDGVEPDTFEHQAWLSVVAFDISDVHLRGWPALPGISRFPEINLRTYVRCAGQPGVWFISLDCPNRLAIALARPWYLLPYRYSPLSLAGGVCTSPVLSARYEPVGDPFYAEPGSLDHWLTERYCYFTRDSRERLYRCDIHHEQWPLQPAMASIFQNLLVPDRSAPAQQHYVERVDAVVWPLAPVPPRCA